MLLRTYYFVFENYIFDCKVLGWKVWVNGILLVSLSCDVCSAFSRSISVRCLPVVTVESGQPRFLKKKWHISSHLLLKSESSLQRRLSLRNLENGMVFFTCCG